MKIFYQSIDDATLSTSHTGTQFPVENLNNRNSNIKYIPDSTTTTYVTVTMDLGSGNARDADYIVLGKVLEQGAGVTQADFQWSDNNVDWNNNVISSDIDSNTESDVLIEFTSVGSHRYWRIVLERATYFSAYELGNIFFGLTFELSHNPEMEASESHGYIVESNEAKGGEMATNLLNTKKRQELDYTYAGFDSTEKAKIETFIETIKPSAGASRYPFFFEDTDGNLHFVRQYGEITFKQIAYNAFECNFNFKTEF